MYIYNRNQAYILSLYILTKKHIFYIYIYKSKEGTKQTRARKHTYSLYIYNKNQAYILFMYIQEGNISFMYIQQQGNISSMYIQQQGNISSMYIQQQERKKAYNRKQVYILFIYIYTTGSIHTLYVYILRRCLVEATNKETYPLCIVYTTGRNQAYNRKHTYCDVASCLSHSLCIHNNKEASIPFMYI
jgi:hypothetical protein